jgi:hypothetical protein
MGVVNLRTHRLEDPSSHLMVSDQMVGTGFVTDALGVHGDEGRRQVGDPRTRAEASIGRRSEQHIELRHDQKGNAM